MKVGRYPLSSRGAGEKFGHERGVAEVFGTGRMREFVLTSRLCDGNGTELTRNAERFVGDPSITSNVPAFVWGPEANLGSDGGDS